MKLAACHTAEINAVIELGQPEIELIEEYRTTLIAHTVTGKIDVRPHEERYASLEQIGQ